MKVLVVSTPIFKLPVSGYSGLEHLAWQTAIGLAKKGHQVSVAAPDNSECEGCTVIPVGPERSIDEARAYLKYKQELPRFDVIVDHSWSKWCYAAKHEKFIKAPVLGVMHAPVDTMYRSLPPVENPCMVCISNDQAKHFEALFSREARVARNGIDMDFYKPLEVKRTNRFLFLARFSSIKGPDIAIDACNQVGVGLDLVGDTSITNEPDYLEQCRSRCDGKRIRMVGPATRGECVHWYSQAHCMIHPNQRFREPLGLAPIESMACGTPVVAWRYGAMRETILHGLSGLLVSSMEELKQAILAMAGKGQFANVSGVTDKMRKECREWASQFSLQAMIDRYEELCKEAIEGGGW